MHLKTFCVLCTVKANDQRKSRTKTYNKETGRVSQPVRSINYAQMYAYDTHLTFAGNNVDIIEQKLNQDLISVSNWLVANKLTLNKSKTNAQNRIYGNWVKTKIGYVHS